MKAILAMLAVMAAPGIALADEYVQGHFTRTNHYVQPYYRTSPDNTTVNNYSHQGNVNPYTQTQGYTNYQNTGYGNAYHTYGN